jgi:hypothetical protein
VGVYDQTGNWAPNRGAHNHPFDECRLFCSIPQTPGDE